MRRTRGTPAPPRRGDPTDGLAPVSEDHSRPSGGGGRLQHRSGQPPLLPPSRLGQTLEGHRPSEGALSSWVWLTASFPIPTRTVAQMYHRLFSHVELYSCLEMYNKAGQLLVVYTI